MQIGATSQPRVVAILLVAQVRLIATRKPRSLMPHDVSLDDGLPAPSATCAASHEAVDCSTKIDELSRFVDAPATSGANLS